MARTENQFDDSYDPYADEDGKPGPRNQTSDAVDYSGWNTPYLPPTPSPQSPPIVQPQQPPVAPAGGGGYEAARDSWMSGRYSKDEAGARQWAADHSDIIDYSGGDTVRLKNGGGMMDILGNWAGGRGNGQAVTQNWTPAGGNGPNPNGVPAGGGGGQPSGIGAGGPAGIGSDLLTMLLARAKQGTNIDAATDPNIRAQADPYRAAQERGARNYTADMAERLGPNANIQGEARVAQEHAAQASGLYESGLVGHEIDQRRQEITDALHELRGYLTNEEEMALRKELTTLTDATQRLGIQNSYDVNMRDLGLRDWIAQNQDYYVRSGLTGQN